MKAVLMSIQPKWCELIASGKKTIEVRKTKPKLETPFKVYIYCTQCFANFRTKTKRSEMWLAEPLNSLVKGRYLGNGKVIGEFICDYILSHCEMANADIAEEMSCVPRADILEYSNGKEVYGLHISDLVIYDEPKELSEFKKINRECWYADLGLAKRDCPECKNAECFVTRPPQSWCYVEGGEADDTLRNDTKCGSSL